MNQRTTEAHPGKPTKALPTDRIKLPKQLDVVRAFGVIYSQTGAPVTFEEAGAIASFKSSTASLMAAFVTQNGMLKRTEGGLVPAGEVVEYARAFEWNTETAAHELAPLIKKCWFAESLMPKLKFGARSEDELVADLAKEVNAAPKYRDQLVMLLSLLESVGLTEREQDGSIKAASGVGGKPVEKVGPKKKDHPAVAPPQSVQATHVSTSFVKPTMGVVQFNVNVNVDMAELSGWSADRLTAFFGGIAQVLAAKSGLEGSETVKE